MTSSRSDLSSKFQYWHQARLGRAQSEISREYSISRQAVSKAIKTQDSYVVKKLMEFSQAMGVLIEWYDETKGILVGFVTQLNNQLILIFIDKQNDTQVLFDQTNLSQGDQNNSVLHNLEITFDVKMSDLSTLSSIIQRLRSR